MNMTMEEIKAQRNAAWDLGWASHERMMKCSPDTLESRLEKLRLLFLDRANKISRTIVDDLSPEAAAALRGKSRAYYETAAAVGSILGRK